MITEHFRVRKRREMLLAQVCVVCGVLLAAWCMSALLTKTGKCMGMGMADILRSHPLPVMETGVFLQHFTRICTFLVLVELQIPSLGRNVRSRDSVVLLVLVWNRVCGTLIPFRRISTEGDWMQFITQGFFSRPFV